MSGLDIAMVTWQDARNPRSWSGSPHFMAQSLIRAGARLSYHGPDRTAGVLLARAENYARRKLGLPRRLVGNSRALATASRNALGDAARPDAVFSAAGSALVSDLRTDAPIFYSSDTTFRLIDGYYPAYSNISARSRREAEALERAAIARAALVFYPTDWAAASAIADYGADPARVRIVPYGANLAEPPDRAEAEARERRAAPELLFVGVDWARKGGPIVVAALDRLRASGIAATVTIIGCVPPEADRRDGMKVFAFLDKNDASDREEIARCYRAADFLFVPTRSECYGIVFCEAAAYGVPSITTDTGGVTGVVRHGETGFCLPPGDTGAGYADLIAALWADPARHAALCAAARADYETRLNWDVWSRRVLSEIGAVLGRPRS
ncbi:MAG: glycosyltransferase family 4 protein [Paracoccaceae bacterium]|nr:glycosyltransferase family 4 protein [Paracoccaceae bacterium]